MLVGPSLRDERHPGIGISKVGRRHLAHHLMATEEIAHIHWDSHARARKLQLALAEDVYIEEEYRWKGRLRDLMLVTGNRQGAAVRRRRRKADWILAHGIISVEML